MPALTIKGYQDDVHSWVQNHGVRYFHEMTNLGILMEEVGEVARLMVRTFGEQSFKAKDKGLQDLADVMFVLTCIANQTGVDLTAALVKNLNKKTRRDSQRHRNNPKLREPE
jgi:NTP pyrophosphatase (non-canonical NTP hydrolase)